MLNLSIIKIYVIKTVLIWHFKVIFNTYTYKDINIYINILIDPCK